MSGSDNKLPLKFLRTPVTINGCNFLRSRLQKKKKISTDLGESDRCLRFDEASFRRPARPSMAVTDGHDAVMHIMGGMCTCRGSQLFDTASARYVPPLSLPRIAYRKTRREREKQPLARYTPPSSFCLFAFDFPVHKLLDCLLRF